MQTQNVVLIVYPQTLGKRAFFLEKADKALSALDSFWIVSPHDPRGFVREHFPRSVLCVRDNARLKAREIQALVREVTHVFVYWDGEDLSGYVHSALLEDKPIRVVPIETTRVVNRDRGDEYDVYIGRKSPWGNPFPIGKDGDSRDEVIAKFKDYFYKEIVDDPKKRSALLSLRGKRLGCHCKPQACHGDIIAEYLNTLE